MGSRWTEKHRTAARAMLAEDNDAIVNARAVLEIQKELMSRSKDVERALYREILEVQHG